MTESRKVQQSVKNIPLQGFGTDSEYAKQAKFKDETEQERMSMEMRGVEWEWCEKVHSTEDRGTCTRPVLIENEKRVEHSGMHLAGNHENIVGAW